jgi:hypothetical protein
MEVNGQFHTPTALSAVPIRLETGWASELVWTQWWGETIPPPARNSGLAAHILVYVLTELLQHFSFGVSNLLMGGAYSMQGRDETQNFGQSERTQEGLCCMALVC